MMAKKILCVPLDPVHDVGIKIIRAELDKNGFITELLSPDLSVHEIIKKAASRQYDFILVSRTLGYGVAELLASFIDQLDAAGIREKSKVVIGGKAITPQLAAELGFDKGFDEHSTIEELIAYLNGSEINFKSSGINRCKKDISADHAYKFFDKEVEKLLNQIADKLLLFVKDKTTPGVERAKIRREIIHSGSTDSRKKLVKKYIELCDAVIVKSYSDNQFPLAVRRISESEITSLKKFLSEKNPIHSRKIQHNEHQPLVFKFLGSGCPMMDIVHGKICERSGINGFLIINPSWEARYEGLLDGLLTHQNDGTITSFGNIKLIRDSLDKSTLLTVRAHRGLNTPETIVLAGEAGADLTKINLVYGALGAGTDPLRLAVDGIEAIKLAAEYKMPFDIPGNDELSGVPAWKTLAGLLINVMIGLKLNAKPVLKPLFCYGPHIVINKLMSENYIDYNAAKIAALKNIVDAPIWPGEPIAFMTQTEDRVQSANSTSYHAALAAGIGVDAITIASTDEAYSRGPISVSSRLDSIHAAADGFNFMGNSKFSTTSNFELYTEMIQQKIKDILRTAASKDNLPEAIYDGVLGSKADGAYPGKFGLNTVAKK